MLFDVEWNIPKTLGGSILVSLCIVFNSNRGETFVLADICLAELTLHGVISCSEWMLTRTNRTLISLISGLLRTLISGLVTVSVRINNLTNCCLFISHNLNNLIHLESTWSRLMQRSLVKMHYFSERERERERLTR